MTNDEILNMKAGREMDALIAKFIFRNVKNSWDWEFTLPNYSTNITDAYAALEIWLDTHLNYTVSIETVNVSGGRIYDVVLWGMDDDTVFSANANTISEAICKVLLLASCMKG